MRIGLIFQLALPVTPAPAAVGDEVGNAPQPRIALLDYEAPVSNDWIAETPTSSMRLYQYRLPGESEELAAHLVVYFFGIAQGGSVDANIARWRSQFSTPEGVSPEPVIKRYTVENLRVTTAEYQGDYSRGVGMGASGQVLKDHILIAAIVETPKGNLFVQLYGPTRTVDRHRVAFADFLNNMRPSKQ